MINQNDITELLVKRQTSHWWCRISPII